MSARPNDHCRSTSPLVKVNVGEDDEMKTFFVHHGLLTQNSSFFTTALKSPWKEAQEQIVELPEDDTDVFELYLQWLYQHKLPMGCS